MEPLIINKGREIDAGNDFEAKVVASVNKTPLTANELIGEERFSRLWLTKIEEMEEILKGYVNTSYIDKTTHETTYLEGHSIAQLVVLPVQDITIVACEELSETERGTNGFGSTNKNKT